MSGFLTTIALMAFLSARPAPQQSAAPASPAPRDVTYCDLVNTPHTFDNARVRVTAFANYGFEDFTLWDPTCAARDDNRFQVWVTFGGTLNSGAIYCCPGEGIPRQGTAPNPIVEDERLTGFRSLLMKERDTVAHFTAIGTFLAKKEAKTPIEKALGTGGYGHFGCCSLFVIERVESFDPHARKDLDYTSTAGFYAQHKCGLASSSWDIAKVTGSSSPGAYQIAEQRAADSGERPWLLVDPQRVALEAVRKVYGDGVKSLKRTKSSLARQVFEWRHGDEWTTIVVSRPYWLSYFARSTEVAWVPTSMRTTDCGK